uniref:Olfactory receptor n=1 Tax=Anas platyrhynchos TaxID=8839 RepID=A0A8B9T2D6_ANAPL
MGVGNGTVISEFILSGFTKLEQRLQLFFCMVLLLMYLTTVMGNAAIIFLVCVDNRLQTPMYFFIGNLAFLEIWFTSSTSTKLLVILSSGRRTISVGSCFAQSSFYFALGGAELALLVVMSFDRYIAICQPLRYAAIMKHQLCIQLVAAVWVMGFTFSIYQKCPWPVPACGHRTFFCEIPQILRLSCSEAYLREFGPIVVSAVLASGCFVFLVLSYVQIFRAVLRIPSQQGQHKAFSTCLPHLAVVSLFISSGTFAYLKPPSMSSSSLNLLLAVLYSVVPPAVNPLIYSMRNQELKDAVWKVMTGVFQKQ